MSAWHSQSPLIWIRRSWLWTRCSRLVMLPSRRNAWGKWRRLTIAPGLCCSCRITSLPSKASAAGQLYWSKAGWFSTVHLKRLELFDGDDRPLRGTLPAGGILKALIYIELENPCANVDAELAFYTLGGERICTAHSAYEPCRNYERRAGEQVFACEIPNLPLVPGEYKIHVGLDIALREADCVEDATRLTVITSDFYGTGILPTKGVFLLDNRWILDHDREEVAP